jgi:hypothetical protein
MGQDGVLLNSYQIYIHAQVWLSLFTITDGHFFKLFDVFRESQFSKSGFA